MYACLFVYVYVDKYVYACQPMIPPILAMIVMQYIIIYSKHAHPLLLVASAKTITLDLNGCLLAYNGAVN